MRGSVKHRRVQVVCAFLFIASSLLATNNPGRIGVAHLDAKGQLQGVSHADERFPMCSTFKFLAVAAVLHRVDGGEEKLDRFIKYSESDLLEWAPIAKEHMHDGGMALEALCAAAISYSDNTAANLILQTLGGPARVTTYARSLGDDVTRLDRTEPELNRVAPGDPRDTTTPMAMLRDMQKILLGDALKKSSRDKLELWMTQNTTGDKLIRSVLPKDWRIGDKTGRNSAGNYNDLAIVHLPNGITRLLSIFVELPGATEEDRAKAIAEAAREVMGVPTRPQSGATP